MGASCLDNAYRSLSFTTRKRLEKDIIAIRGLSLNPKSTNPLEIYQNLLEKGFLESKKYIFLHDVVNNTISKHRSNRNDPCEFDKLLEELTGLKKILKQFYIIPTKISKANVRVVIQKSPPIIYNVTYTSSNYNHLWNLGDWTTPLLIMANKNPTFIQLNIGGDAEHSELTVINYLETHKPTICCLNETKKQLDEGFAAKYIRESTCRDVRRWEVMASLSK